MIILRKKDDNNKNLQIPNPYKDCSRYVCLNNNDIFIAEKGKGENMILINGIAASSFTWRKIFYKLSEVFHVIAMDFKGTGFSDKPESKYSISMYTDQLLKLMIIMNLEKAILVGNSLGGEVALDFTVKYPDMVSSLILIDSAGYQENKEITSELVKAGRYKITEIILKLLTTRAFTKGIIKWAVKNHSIIDNNMVEGYYRPLKDTGGTEAFVSLVRNLSYTDFDFTKIKKIKKPSLIIWGKQDKWIPVSDAYKFQKAIKDSKIVILENCGHAPQEEKPEEVLRHIKAFLGYR